MTFEKIAKPVAVAQAFRKRPSTMTSGILEVPWDGEQSPKHCQANGAAHSWRLVLGLFIGYGFYNTLRGTFPLQMSAVAEDLSIPVDRIGVPSSVFSAGYGLGKFFGSIATDHVPCAECHALGILLCGLAAAALGLCSSLSDLAWLWCLQGVLQAFGWPFLARIVVDELPSEVRARYWGALSMAGNVGCMLTPYGLLLAKHAGLGWRGNFFAAGAFATFVAAGVWYLLCCGRPRHSGRRSFGGQGRTPSTVTSSASARAVLTNPVLVLLMVCMSLSFASSKCVKEWGSMYLRGTQLATSELQIATLLFWAEVGGSVGAVASGFCSTRLGGRHAFTCMSSALLSTLALGALTWVSLRSTQVEGAPLPFALVCMLQAASVAGINGVRTLTGFHAAEIAALNGLPVGMTNGFIEVVGQMGSVMAGQPLGALVAFVSGTNVSGGGGGSDARLGWVAILATLTAASVIMASLNLALLPQEERRLTEASSKLE